MPRRGRALRWAIVWVAVCAGLVLAAPKLMQGIPLHGSPILAQKAPAPPQPQAAAAKPVQPSPYNVSVYRADPSGHFFIDAEVNGAPVHFLVDTGATFVALTPDDAHAAGISRGMLHFDLPVSTANGLTRAARVKLREIRLGQLTQDEVPAVVMEAPLNVSLLGMSFLRRLDGYEIRDGKLSLSW